VNVVQILSAVRHSRAGALLIAVQIALTLTIVSNSLSIISQRVQRMLRPSGLDEANVLIVANQWTNPSANFTAYTQADVAALRALPGVIDAVSTDEVPLEGSGENGWIALKPDERPASAWTGLYTLDEHGLSAFGLRLVAGRWFSPEESRFTPSPKERFPAVAVVSKALARTLFPAGGALGKKVYYVNRFPVRIVGIVDRLEAGIQPLENDEFFASNSLIVPGRYAAPKLFYVIRARAGRRDAVMRRIPAVLERLTSARVIDEIVTVSSIRGTSYHGARALIIILAGLSLLILLVTALGMVGISSYWVSRRRWQIGVRRALGASRGDILGYLHSENLLIVGCGAALGIAGTLGVNAWLTHILELSRIGLGVIIIGAVIVVTLGQVAVAWPAMRAASIPPGIAARVK